MDDEQEPKTRKAALKSGASKYYTGKPCKQGHVGYRWTLNGACIECTLKARQSEIAAYKIAKAQRKE